ncbi:glycosyltransferase family 4 protein [Robertkochia aurantiaca]|uniref:glycosyltransferase family 4 protein n=1 Tax=Robertkochia aurantiaca TaxID=2873700 RepID=UPI001CCB9BB3|nr:glycosyltransferase family 4 protein [Robertkochia sp. 3YJGBD-33]
MKILYIHQFFKTPEDPGGTRSYWIARELIDQGHQVTMLTSNKPLTQKKEIEYIDGIEVIYLNVIYDSGKMSIYERYKAFIQFVVRSTPEALNIKNVDLVIATSTPLTVGIPALVLKKFKNIPYVFEVRDLWPEVPIQMGGLKNPILKKTALWLEKVIYRNSLHIIALSPGMKEGILNRNVDPLKISTIPNMSKIDKFWRRPKDLKLQQHMGLRNDSFKAIYFGAMNIANDIPYIIEAGKKLIELKKDRIEIFFLGDGASKEEMQKKCKDENIHNIKFFDKVPMEELSEIVNLADVSLVTFSNIPILATNSPNKLFDSLSAGKAIIVNSPGWTRTLVKENNCGVYVDPMDSSDLAKTLIYLSENPDLCNTMGENARNLAEKKYDKSLLCRQFAEIVDKKNQAKVKEML